MDISDSSNTNFFKYVFNFDNDSKTEILNILQYALISVILLTILLKTMGRYVPDGDDKKGSVELVAEIVVQVIALFLGFLIIHRIITFIPTYSGGKYPSFHIEFIILPVLTAMITFQTKLGEKISILIERITDLWEGTGGDKKAGSKNKKKGGQNSNANPNANAVIMTAQTPNQAAMNQSLYTDGTSIGSLPSSDLGQSLPDYNNMYRKDTTPLVNAASPGQMSGDNGFMEPMAANSVLGGGSFGSW